MKAGITPKSTNIRPIALALSGGGVRAMVFHTGVIKWLAEQNKLELVRHISTVSGGSLYTGLVLKISGWKWPSSSDYLSYVYPEIKRILVGKSLQGRALTMMANPMNWKHLFSRANVLAKAIEDLWGIDKTLKELPSDPIWSINCTTAETGRRFRFKQDGCGDYEIGYAKAENFKVSEAMAASAAFPFLIGPFSINSSKLKWYKRNQWNTLAQAEELKEPLFRNLHLMDGGIYDNLGMEPFYDIGKQTPKGHNYSIWISDAGALLKRMPLSPKFRLERTKRIVDIVMDQARSLRVRAFIPYINSDHDLGKYIHIGDDPREIANQYQDIINERVIIESEWLSKAQIDKAKNWPTDLDIISNDLFDLVSTHGYETAHWNETLFTKN